MVIQPITIIEVEHRADEHCHIAAVFPQLVDLGGQFVDPLVALMQQEFQPAGVLLFGC
jgi:hypothetical protein